MPALKDAQGSYWIKYGSTGPLLCCLTLDGPRGFGYIDRQGGVSPATLEELECGPFARVYLDVTEVDVTKTCDDCLHDRHFCYACDDAVEHGHVHEED